MMVRWKLEVFFASFFRHEYVIPIQIFPDIITRNFIIKSSSKVVWNLLECSLIAILMSCQFKNEREKEKERGGKKEPLFHTKFRFYKYSTITIIIVPAINQRKLKSKKSLSKLWFWVPRKDDKCSKAPLYHILIIFVQSTNKNRYSLVCFSFKHILKLIL